MLEGLRTAAAGMAAQQNKLDAVANDLANANTTGYKRVRVGFADLLYDQAGRPAAEGVTVGHGARAVQAGRGFAAGHPARDGQPARRRHPGRGLHPRPAVRRAPGAHARRRPAPRRQPPPGHQHRRARPARDHGPARASPSPTSRSPATARSSPAAARSARSRSSTCAPTAGLLSAGENAFVTTAASGNAAAAPANDRPDPGRARGLEHRHGLGDGRDDRGAAHLPADVEGDPDRRPDDGDRQRGEAMISNVFASRRRARRRHRRRQELQGRRRLRADARLPARQGDGRRHRPARARARSRCRCRTRFRPSLVSGRGLGLAQQLYKEMQS